ncbi:hypothetical protein ACFZDK_50145 [Streptomyces sp. NPDC007901]|uniref:hypothetical protein n=1 Tax=Streptomyces sp. NPDC007901 TaxID=3364785 RepID=UPI0036EE4609
MPPVPEQSSSPPADAEQTAILDPVPGASSAGGYGDRFEEDAFDYPSSGAHSWSADLAPRGAGEPVAEPQEPAARRAARTRAVRSADGWRHAVVRPRSLLTTAAALVVLGGFGFALSTVSDTVTSPTGPGGTAEVSAPKSPTAQPVSPTPPVTSDPPRDTVSPTTAPTQTSVPPGAGEDRDRGEEHGREDQGREDGDDAHG